MTDTATAAPSSGQVIDTLRSYQFRWNTEADLQAGLAGALTASGWPVQREVRLSRTDRIDLLVGRVGMEVKVGHGASTARVERVLTQLARYAASDLLDELVLVTTSRKHADCPPSLGGKPLHVLIIPGRLS